MTDQPYPTEAISSAVQQKVLTQTRLGASVAASIGVIAERGVEGGVEGPAEYLRIQLEAYCLTDRLVHETKWVNFDEQVDFTRPATWWAHYRLSQANFDPIWRWLNRRWPPRMVTETHRVTKSVPVTFEAKALYPRSDYVLPGHGKPTIFESYSTEHRPTYHTRPTRRY